MISRDCSFSRSHLASIFTGYGWDFFKARIRSGKSNPESAILILIYDDWVHSVLLDVILRSFVEDLWDVLFCIPVRMKICQTKHGCRYWFGEISKEKLAIFYIWFLSLSLRSLDNGQDFLNVLYYCQDLGSWSLNN